MEKVRAKEGAIKWFNSREITVGKIYDFPTITFDNGRESELNDDKSVWHKEFEFIETNPSINNSYSII